MAFTIEKYHEEYDLSVFSDFDCRYTDYDSLSRDLKAEIVNLCNFPKTAAIKNYHTHGMGITRFLRDGEIGIGYFTLSTGEIKEEPVGDETRSSVLPTDKTKTAVIPELIGKYPNKPYPAVRITHLAIDSHYQGADLELDGENMGRYSKVMMDAVKRISKELSISLGIRCIMVDALACGRTLKYYERQGFIPRPTEVGKFRKMKQGRYTGADDSISMYLDLSKIKHEDISRLDLAIKATSERKLA